MRVLVVEDEPKLAGYLRKGLTENGYVVDVAADGRSALDRMRHEIYEALSAPDVPCEAPAVAGAFYYLIRVDSRLDSMTLTERLIREHKVATIPGRHLPTPRRARSGFPMARSSPRRWRRGLAAWFEDYERFVRLALVTGV